jgi:hypothetical protein
LREHAAVGEEGDLGDLAAGECEDDQPIRARDVCVRAREIAAEGGLTVGPGRDEPPQRRLVARAADAQEVSDRRGALVLVRVGGVVSQASSVSNATTVSTSPSSIAFTSRHTLAWLS